MHSGKKRKINDIELYRILKTRFRSTYQDITDDETINTAFPTPTVATAKSHSGTSNDLNVTAESGAVTVSGTPANDDMVFFQVNRDVSADDQSGDARLLGIKITFII